MKNLLKSIVVTILTIEARLVLLKYDPKIIAVTGSVGKTSTKDAIYTMLSNGHYVRKSQKSFNSELGVPLTILGLPNAWSSLSGWLGNILEGLHLLFSRNEYPEWLVLEVGADRPGDIRRLHWLKPHIAVYTRFPDVPVHVEFFESPEQVIAEKRELGKALRPQGTLIVNADDPKMVNETLQEGQNVISYGFAEGAVVRGMDSRVHYEQNMPNGMDCTVSFQAETHQVVLQQALGTQHLYSLLAALAVAAAEGLKLETSIAALAEHRVPPGRMHLIDGINGSVIVDDTYNASPVAVEAGLNTLTSMHVPGRKIVVLGDMMELGDYSVAEHKKVGEHVAMTADYFVAVGVRMRAAAESAQATTHQCERIEAVQDTAEATTLLRETLSEGDVVLVKGSQSVRMEKIVANIMRNPAAAPTELVRQEEEWQKR